jgi:MFS family permease
MTGSKFLRFFTLSLLYFVQGAPYGFQSSCLPLLLRESGLSLFAIGAMKLLYLPWVCKPFFAPIVETTRTKKFWLTSSMLALAATCFVAAGFSSPEDLAGLAALMFALNFFSASQDIATDSLAVRILSPSELGAGNTVQVVAYKAGSVFAGGVLLLIRDVYGWSAMFNCFAGIYVIAVVLLRQLALVERTSQEDAKKTDKDKEDCGSRGGLQVLRSVLSVRGTFGVAIFLLTYKLCETSARTFSLYQVDKGVPRATMAFWSTIASSSSLLGSSYGGWILYKEDARDVVTRFSWFRAVTIAGLAAILMFWGHERVSLDSLSDSVLMYLGFAMTSLTLFSAGVITTATFTIMMRLSQKEAPAALAGSHYTTLATFEILGKLAFAGVAGGLMDLFGMEAMYVAFVALAAVCPMLSRRTLPETKE